eukprot:9742542-Prorocentrum_lima.AAC.1
MTHHHPPHQPHHQNPVQQVVLRRIGPAHSSRQKGDAGMVANASLTIHCRVREREIIITITCNSDSCQGDDRWWTKAVPKYSCRGSFCEKGIGGYWCK